MEDKRMSVIDHLSELRIRIITAILSILFFTSLSYFNINNIVDFIIKPVEGIKFIYTAPADLFLIYIKIAFICGITGSVPVIIFNIWNFIKPGLKQREKSLLLVSLIFGNISFLLGVLFAYLIVTPIIFDFFIKFSYSIEMVDALFTFGSYIDFLSTFLLAFGIIFEMPLVIMILSKIGLISSDTMKKHRKMAILVIFIFATILTPPDVVSQMFIALPMVMLYEVSIIISRVSFKNKIS